MNTPLSWWWRAHEPPPAARRAQSPRIPHHLPSPSTHPAAPQLASPPRSGVCALPVPHCWCGSCGAPTWRSPLPPPPPPPHSITTCGKRSCVLQCARATSAALAAYNAHAVSSPSPNARIHLDTRTLLRGRRGHRVVGANGGHATPMGEGKRQQGRSPASVATAGGGRRWQLLRGQASYYLGA